MPTPFGIAFDSVTEKSLMSSRGVPVQPIDGTVWIDVVFPTPYAYGIGRARYHDAVGSACTKSSSMLATFVRPLFEGCVPSDWKSAHAQVNPSLRGVSPSAQLYVPQSIHGATTAPRAGSKLSAGDPLIWSSIVHLHEKPCSYEYGS